MVSEADLRVQLVDQDVEVRAAALELIVHRYHAAIVTYAYRMLLDHPRAEDVAQETFERLMRVVAKNDVPRNLKPWLYRVAANRCRDWLRSGANTRERPYDESGLDASSAMPVRAKAGSGSGISFDPPDPHTPVDLAERQWERQRVVRALLSLELGMREVVVLRFYHDLSLEEVAETLEIPLGTVKSRLWRALAKLEDQLKEDELKLKDEEAKRGWVR